MNAPNLTPRQRKILRFIAKSIDKNGYQPSIREIGEAFGISSPNGVACHIRSLQKKGVIEKSSELARCLRFEWRKYL